MKMANIDKNYVAILAKTIILSIDMEHVHHQDVNAYQNTTPVLTFSNVFCLWFLF